VVFYLSREDVKGVRTVIVEDEGGSKLERFTFGLKGIRSIKGLLQGLWSLNPFSEGLSGNNGFSDVDAHTEIDGRSLILEFKQTLRGMNKGQLLKAIRQAKFQKTCTWFIEGETDTPVRMIQVNENGIEGEYGVSELSETSIEGLQTSIRNWEKWAKANSLVKGKKSEEWNKVTEIIHTCRTPK
jgi:hypothetical protein